MRCGVGEFGVARSYSRDLKMRGSTIESGEITGGSSSDEQAQMIIVKFMIRSHRDLQTFVTQE